MKSGEAIQALMKAGRADEAKAVIDKYRSVAQGQYDYIYAEEGRTEDWKVAEFEKAFEQTKARVNDELNRLAGSAKSNDQSDYAKVLGSLGISGDPATLVISRRDAADRVSGVTNGEELRELLARATRTGDEVLARAIADKALERRDAKTFKAFADDRPHLEDAAQRLWDLKSRGSDNFAANMLLHSLRPHGERGVATGLWAR